MGKFQDLTGMTFGRLTVIERAPNIGKQTAWRCRCSCGNECIVQAGNLKNGQKTCGCGSVEKFIERNTKHGMEGTKIYGKWSGMLDRCENPNCKDYPRYGGRGIKVCERWHIFENFYADVSVLPHFNEAGYSLDRIDVNGNYCPENVRWATAKEQNRNRRNNTIVEYNGVQMCLKEAAEKSGISYQTLVSRYRVGKRGDDLFATSSNIVEYNGVQMTLPEAAEKSGINYNTLKSRYRTGKRGDDLLKIVTTK